MDLSLIPTDALIKELIRRLNIDIIVAMDRVAAMDYFEGSYPDDFERPEHPSPSV